MGCAPTHVKWTLSRRRRAKRSWSGLQRLSDSSRGPLNAITRNRSTKTRHPSAPLPPRDLRVHAKIKSSSLAPLLLFADTVQRTGGRTIVSVLCTHGGQDEYSDHVTRLAGGSARGVIVRRMREHRARYRAGHRKQPGESKGGSRSGGTEDRAGDR